MRSLKRRHTGIPDAGGLFLHIMPSGSKTWRVRYWAGEGKEQTLTVGKYPDVSLAEARQARDVAKSMKWDGVDPARHKKIAPSVPLHKMTFEKMAREWFQQSMDLCVRTSFSSAAL